jgi:endonuclease YncB( thermonuclease family)
MYQISTKALSIFLEVGILECAPLGEDPVKDRDIMYCLSDGVDVGAMMVKTGFAHEYPTESKGVYESAETFAKENKLGIWEEEK